MDQHDTSVPLDLLRPIDYTQEAKRVSSRAARRSRSPRARPRTHGTNTPGEAQTIPRLALPSQGFNDSNPFAEQFSPLSKFRGGGSSRLPSVPGFDDIELQHPPLPSQRTVSIPSSPVSVRPQTSVATVPGSEPFSIPAAFASTGRVDAIWFSTNARRKLQHLLQLPPSLTEPDTPEAFLTSRDRFKLPALAQEGEKRYRSVSPRPRKSLPVERGPEMTPNLRQDTTNLIWIVNNMLCQLGLDPIGTHLLTVLQDSGALAPVDEQRTKQPEVPHLPKALSPESLKSANTSEWNRLLDGLRHAKTVAREAQWLVNNGEPQQIQRALQQPNAAMLKHFRFNWEKLFCELLGGPQPQQEMQRNSSEESMPFLPTTDFAEMSSAMSSVVTLAEECLSHLKRYETKTEAPRVLSLLKAVDGDGTAAANHSHISEEVLHAQQRSAMSWATLTTSWEEAVRKMQEETIVYSVAFWELIRQETVLCRERGALLADIRARYLSIIVRMLRMVTIDGELHITGLSKVREFASENLRLRGYLDQVTPTIEALEEDNKALKERVRTLEGINVSLRVRAERGVVVQDAYDQMLRDMKQQQLRREKERTAAVVIQKLLRRALAGQRVARLRAEQYRRDSIASFGSAASDDAEALLRDYEKRREELAAFTIQRCLTAKVGVRAALVRASRLYLRAAMARRKEYLDLQRRLSSVQSEAQESQATEQRIHHLRVGKLRKRLKSIREDFTEVTRSALTMEKMYQKAKKQKESLVKEVSNAQRQITELKRELHLLRQQQANRRAAGSRASGRPPSTPSMSSNSFKSRRSSPSRNESPTRDGARSVRSSRSGRSSRHTSSRRSVGIRGPSLSSLNSEDSGSFLSVAHVVDENELFEELEGNVSRAALTLTTIGSDSMDGSSPSIVNDGASVIDHTVVDPSTIGSIAEEPSLAGSEDTQHTAESHAKHRKTSKPTKDILSTMSLQLRPEAGKRRKQQESSSTAAVNAHQSAATLPQRGAHGSKVQPTKEEGNARAPSRVEEEAAVVAHGWSSESSSNTEDYAMSGLLMDGTVSGTIQTIRVPNIPKSALRSGEISIHDFSDEEKSINGLLENSMPNLPLHLYSNESESGKSMTEKKVIVVRVDEEEWKEFMRWRVGENRAAGDRVVLHDHVSTSSSTTSIEGWYQAPPSPTPKLLTHRGTMDSTDTKDYDEHHSSEEANPTDHSRSRAKTPQPSGSTGHDDHDGRSSSTKQSDGPMEQWGSEHDHSSSASTVTVATAPLKPPQPLVSMPPARSGTTSTLTFTTDPGSGSITGTVSTISTTARTAVTVSKGQQQGKDVGSQSAGEEAGEEGKDETDQQSTGSQEKGKSETSEAAQGGEEEVDADAGEGSSDSDSDLSYEELPRVSSFRLTDGFEDKATSLLMKLEKTHLHLRKTSRALSDKPSGEDGQSEAGDVVDWIGDAIGIDAITEAARAYLLSGLQDPNKPKDADDTATQSDSASLATTAMDTTTDGRRTSLQDGTPSFGDSQSIQTAGGITIASPDVQEKLSALEKLSITDAASTLSYLQVLDAHSEIPTTVVENGQEESEQPEHQPPRVLADPVEVDLAMEMVDVGNVPDQLHAFLKEARTAGRVPRGCQWTLNALDKSLRLFQDRMQHTLRIQRNKVIFPRLDVWDSKDFVFSPRGKRVKQVFPFLWTPWEQLMLVLQRRYGLTSIVNRELHDLALGIDEWRDFHPSVAACGSFLLPPSAPASTHNTSKTAGLFLLHLFLRQALTAPSKSNASKQRPSIGFPYSRNPRQRTTASPSLAATTRTRSPARSPAQSPAAARKKHSHYMFAGLAPVNVLGSSLAKGSTIFTRGSEGPQATGNPLYDTKPLGGGASACFLSGNARQQLLSHGGWAERQQRRRRRWQDGVDRFFRMHPKQWDWEEIRSSCAIEAEDAELLTVDDAIEKAKEVFHSSWWQQLTGMICPSILWSFEASLLTSARNRMEFLIGSVVSEIHTVAEAYATSHQRFTMKSPQTPAPRRPNEEKPTTAGGTPLMSTLRRGETGKSDWWPSGAMEDLSLPTPRDRRQRYDALDLAIPRSFGQQRRLTASLHRTFQASAHQEGMAGTAQPPRHQPPPPLSARPSYRPTTQGRNLRVAGFSLSRYSRRSKSQQPRPQTLPTLQSSPWDAPKQTPVISLQALLHMLTRLALRLVCEAKLWDWARQAFHACDRNNNGFAPFHSLTAVYHTMVPPPISPVALHQMYNQQLEARHTSQLSRFGFISLFRAIVIPHLSHLTTAQLIHFGDYFLSISPRGQASIKAAASPHRFLAFGGVVLPPLAISPDIPTLSEVHIAMVEQMARKWNTVRRLVSEFSLNLTQSPNALALKKAIAMMNFKLEQFLGNDTVEAVKYTDLLALRALYRSIVAQLLAATFTAAPKNPREEASVEVVDQEVDVLNKLVQFVVPQ